MRYNLLLLFIFFLNVCTSQKVTNDEINDLFKKTKKIEIISYLDRAKWDRTDKKKYFIKNDTIKINEKHIRDRIVLSKNQRNKLKKAIEDCKLDKTERADCFNPRHLVVFFDTNNEIVGYSELCFLCNRSEFSQNFKIISECLLNQEKLFKEFGIKYFEETDEETEEYYKNQEKEMMELEERYRNKKKKTDE